MTRKKNLTWLFFIIIRYFFLYDLLIGIRKATPVGLSRDLNVTYEVISASPAKLQRMEGPQKVWIMVWLFLIANSTAVLAWALFSSSHDFVKVLAWIRKLESLILNK
jgi:hypothetical protein